MVTHAQLMRAGGVPQHGGVRDTGNARGDRILAAARTLFLKLGYGETSMDAIARHAPLSQATPYSHFAGKDALFAALVVTECRHLSDEIGRRALDEPDIRDALLRVAHDFTNLLCTGIVRSMYRIVVAEVPYVPTLGQCSVDSWPRLTYH